MQVNTQESGPAKLAVSVAPMEGLTTFPTRLWLHMASKPNEMTTPFLRVTKNHPDRKIPDHFIPELTVLKGKLPYKIVPQFITGEPDNFLRACEFIFPHMTSMVEINCGCPCPTSSGKLAGSGILADPDSFAKTVASFSDRLGPKHLAVKMRAGIVSGEEFSALFSGIKDLPLGRLTIHGRTRKAGYKGLSDWQMIHRAAEETSIPVVGSGDIICQQSFGERVAGGGKLSGVMIGRGAMINPWIFDLLAGGSPREITSSLLANCLLCYVLIHELWQRDDRKLFARVEQERLGFFCGYDEEKWQGTVRLLMQTLGGYPSAINGPGNIPTIPVGGNSLSRLKVLWGYMRSQLPPEYMRPAIMKSTDIQTFFEQFFCASESIQH